MSVSRLILSVLILRVVLRSMIIVPLDLALPNPSTFITLLKEYPPKCIIKKGNERFTSVMGRKGN